MKLMIFSGNDWSDIDGIIDSGSKLTTIDRDEWMKCVGVPDGRGCRLLLSLRLPDGNRQMVEVEDTTTLKVKSVKFHEFNICIFCQVHHVY